MKSKVLILFLLAMTATFAQTINDYKAVIIPLKYDFQKSENQYRLNTLSKYNFTKAGFVAFYQSETIPAEYNDRCSLLYANVIEDKGFLITKVYITLSDCSNKILFTSVIGKSKEKEFEAAYSDAINKAFVSVTNLHYKYSGNPVVNSAAVVAPVVVPTPAVSSAISVMPAVAVVAVPVIPAVTNGTTMAVSNEVASTEKLYAQSTANGFQLIDSTPKVVMKLFKTSNPNSFVAVKGTIQGVLQSKDNQWFFEYYQNDTLVSEKLDIKF